MILYPSIPNCLTYQFTRITEVFFVEHISAVRVNCLLADI